MDGSSEYNFRFKYVRNLKNYSKGLHKFITIAQFRPIKMICVLHREKEEPKSCYRWNFDCDVILIKTWQLYVSIAKHVYINKTKSTSSLSKCWWASLGRWVIWCYNGCLISAAIVTIDDYMQAEFSLGQNMNYHFRSMPWLCRCRFFFFSAVTLPLYKYALFIAKVENKSSRDNSLTNCGTWSSRITFLALVALSTYTGEVLEVSSIYVIATAVLVDIIWISSLKTKALVSSN